MRKLKSISGTMLLLVLGLTGLQAQETPTASGGEATGSGGIVSYSIGQVNCSTNTGTNGSVAEGVQQTYEISVVTGIEETAVSLNISAFPNPTTDYLQLRINGDKPRIISYQLYNITGKFLEQADLPGMETQIDMSSYTPDVYFVKIFDNKHVIKIFKIIKK